MGERRCSSNDSYHWCWIEVSGQYYALTALNPMEKPRIPIEYELVVEPVWTIWETETSCTCLESKHDASAFQLLS